MEPNTAPIPHTPRPAGLHAAGGLPNFKPPSGADFGSFGGGGDGGDDGGGGSNGEFDPIWGEPGSGEKASIGEIFSNTFVLMRRSFGPLFIAWLLMTFAGCLCECPGWLIRTPLGADAGIGATGLEVGSYIFGFVTVLISMLGASILAGLFYPMRRLLVEGPYGTVESAQAALQLALPKVPGAFVIVVAGTLLSIVGTLFCIFPGLILGAIATLTAYIFVAVDLPIPDAAREAVRLAQKNAGAIATAIAMTFFIALVAGGLNFGCFYLSPKLESDWTPILIGLASFTMRFVLLLFLWNFWCSVCITIEGTDADVGFFNEEVDVHPDYYAQNPY